MQLFRYGLVPRDGKRAVLWRRRENTGYLLMIDSACTITIRVILHGAVTKKRIGIGECDDDFRML